MLRHLKRTSIYRNPRRTLLAALILLGASLMAIWGGYVLVVNAYLNIGRGSVFSIDVAEVRVGSAFTWWPGRVKGRDLQVLVHDSKVELELKVERFDVNLSVVSLLRKVVSTTKTDVQGVTVRGRTTRMLPELCKQAPGLAPISGQAEPPGAGGAKDCLAQAEKAMAPGPPAVADEQVRVRLENLNVSDIREVWAEDYRLQGSIGLQGRWAFWPTQNMELELRQFEMHEASISQAEARIVQKLDLILTGGLKQVQFDDLDAKALWSAISVKASTRVESLELKAIRRLVLKADPIAPPKFPDLDGLSNLQGEISMKAGQMDMVSLDAQAGQAAIALLDRYLMGSMRLRLRLNGDPKHPGRLLLSKSSLKISNLQLQEGQEKRQWFKDTELTVTVQDSSYLDPTAQKAELEFSAQVSQSRFIIALIPGGLPHTITELLVSDRAPATATGTLRATPAQTGVQNLHAEADGLKLTGSFVLVPKLKGTLTAKYSIISVDIPL